MKALVILGTNRDDSNTKKAVQDLCPFSEYKLIALHNLNIQPYSYEPNYESKYSAADDFLSVAKQMIDADHIVFATPVYWYSMSGTMKIFFDRLTDLLFSHKSIGKALKGKKTYLIASGAEAELPEGFEVPFKRTSDYFDMKFQNSYYVQII